MILISISKYSFSQCRLLALQYSSMHLLVLVASYDSLLIPDCLGPSK